MATGGGIHAYWLSDRTLTVEEWQPYANALKIAARNSSLKADLVVISDSARVLRVPGTFNYKYTPPRPVRLLPQFCNAAQYEFSTAFSQLLTLTPVGSLGPLPDEFKGLDTKISLGDGIEYTSAPVPLEPVLEGCAWLREAYETGGRDHNEPQWHLAILAATFMEDGRDIADRLGNKHPGYSPASTEDKWERALRQRRDKNLGWPQCRTIQDNGSGHCAICPHLAAGRSPLNLGLFERKIEEIKELGGRRAIGFELPEGFCLNEQGHICAFMPAKKLKGKNAGVSSPRLLRLTTNIITNPSLQVQEGQFGIAFTASTDLGGSHEVFIASAHIYAPAVLNKLSARCVLYPASDDGRKMMEQLMVSWLEKLKNEQRAVRDSGTLGWRYDGGKKSGFVFGGVFYSIDGTVTQTTNTTDDEFRKWYAPTGSKEPWLRACKLLTDRKRPELDILIAIAFAAPLMAFVGNVYGCILSVWGEPGTSKSTAQQVAAAVFGHPKQTRETLASTTKSVQGRLGRIKNLAAYWDDIQDEKHQEFLCETMFATSGGAEGGRLNPDASYKERKEWQTLLVACSNASFVDFLIKKQKSTTAGMRRVLEFEYNRHVDEPGMIDGFDANRVFAELEHNHGIVGAEYAQLLAKDHAQVDKLVSDITHKFKDIVKGTADESFWWNMCGTLIAGATLANKLGAEFNVPVMARFLALAYLKNRKTRSQEGTEGGSYTNTEQSLATFLNVHSGGGHIVYTDTTYKNKTLQVHMLQGPMAGRTAYVQVARDERKLLISKRRLREYLQDNGIQIRQVVDGLAKFFQAREVRATIGAGTGLGMAQEQLLELVVPAGMVLLENVMDAHGPARV